MNRIFLIILFLFLYACDDKNSFTTTNNKVIVRNNNVKASNLSAKNNFIPNVTEIPSNKQNNKIIKNGSITFEVNNIENTDKEIQNLIKKYNAYIFNDNLYESDNKRTKSLIIKVPSNNFDNLLNDIIKLIKNIESESINADDITKQYFDIKTRLNNKKQLEQRYLEIIKKATKVSDLLEIERNLNNVRTEIENLTTQINDLNNQINFSTLTIDFYVHKNNSFKYFYNFNNAFHESWTNFIKLLLFIIKYLSYFIIGIIFIIVTKRIIKKYK